MVIRTRILSFLQLAEKIHDSSISKKTGLLDETDEHLVFLHIFAYYGMFE
jgi:ATP-dependent helicase/DNAse subunit B